MSENVIVLGAGGRLGKAATHAFLQNGWRVSLLARSDDSIIEVIGAKSIVGDVYELDSLRQAIKGHDVVVNALNPPYPDWAQDVPRLTSNVISAAHSASATVMVPGNIYNYGVEMPKQLRESTPQLASTKKGKIRIQMESEYQKAAENGLQTIILRGGDFIEKAKTGNWFDSYIVNRINKGLLTYPGPLDQCHAWAFLPDMAKALVQLANKRSQFNAFEEFGYQGFNITGQTLVNEVEASLSRSLKIKKMPWSMMSIAALFSPMVKEVLEMRYLWEVPHKIDGTKLKKVLPEFKPSTLAEALKEVLN